MDDLDTKAFIEAFVRERNEALMSLDAIKIKAYCKKYEVRLPSSEKSFWIGVHKMILLITDAPPDVIERSRKWLIERGYRDGM